MTDGHDFSEQAKDAAKQLAPWSTRIPWWVVLIEGIVVGGIGLVAAFNPTGANVTLALALTVGLVIAGLVQVWGIVSEDVPERIDASVGARAGIAIYAGLLLLLFYFLPNDPVTGQQVLSRVAGYGAFGTAALIYGLLALVQVFRTDGSSRRQALIEFLLFGSVGLVTLWALYSGGDAVVTAVQIVGWIFIIGGVALIALAIWRQQKGDEADEMIESFTQQVEDTTDKVTSIGQSKEVQDAKEDLSEAVEDAQDAIEEAIDEPDK